MAGECLAIVAVILVMAFMFLRAKKGFFALMVLPLISVPLGYLLGWGLYSAGSQANSFANMGIGFILGGLVLDIGLCLAFSRAIPTRRGKTAYLVLAILFPALLSVNYISRLL